MTDLKPIGKALVVCTCLICAACLCYGKDCQGFAVLFLAAFAIVAAI